MNKTQRLYGFLLSLGHVVTLFFWSAFDAKFGLIQRLQTPDHNPWPFVPQFLPDFISSHPVFFTYTYIGLIALSLIAFLSPKVPDKILWSLFTATLTTKLLIYFSSYGFMGNYHYMANIIMLAYIITRAHLSSLQVMIAFFYFGAGLIKLNWEWISGSSLLRDTFLDGPWLIAACCYVIVLELILIWGLFSKNNLIKKLIFFQLVGFHLFSWHIVGFYYPLTMLLLLSIFLISPVKQGLFQQIRNPKLAIYCLLFLIAQAYPKVLNKDESLTAEGRMLSLNMLDAKTECLASFYTKSQGVRVYIDNPLKLATRIKCDPLVYFNYGKSLCSENNSSILFNLDSKKTTDFDYTSIVRDLDICSPTTSYSIWGNAWVDPQAIAYKMPAFEADSTSVNWRYNLQRTGESNQSLKISGKVTTEAGSINSNIHSAAKSTPVVIGDKWLVASDAGFIFSKSTDTWTAYFPNPNFGFHSSPSATANSILVGAYDGILHHIGTDGKRIWGKNLGSFIGSSPLLDNQNVYISVENAGQKSQTFKLTLDGKILWKSDAYPGLAHASPTLSRDGSLVFSSSNGGSLRAFHTQTGKTAWEHQLAEKFIATPVVTSTAVIFYSVDGLLTARDPATGSTIWSLNLPSGGRATPSYSNRNNILIVSSESGKHYGIQEGKIIWQLNTAPYLVASGLIADSSNGEIFWGPCGARDLCSISVANGKLLQTISLKSSFSSTPVIWNKKILITHEGNGSSIGYSIIE